MTLKNKTYIFSTIFAILTLFTSFNMTSAQITPGRSEVSALIGTFQFEDRRFDDSGSFGAVYRYYVTRRYSFEAGFALSRPSFTGTVINETTNTAVSKLNADATVFLYHVNAIYNFILSSRVVTFTTGGIGGTTTDIEDLDATSGTVVQLRRRHQRPYLSSLRDTSRGQRLRIIHRDRRLSALKR